ncbi:MAG: ABC transporter permease [Actinomycetota bacterium]|nr:ABC transporter permease [Actinomycetota bacterium]
MTSPGLLRLDNRPASVGTWLRELWKYRHVLVMLAKKDFRVRYKRASLGLAWAFAVPLLQSIVLVFVFSRVGRFGAGAHFSYAAFVLAGMVPWIYMSSTVAQSTQAVVDASSLTDKVWFPRAILVLVPTLSGMVTLVVAVAILLVELPIVGVPLGWNLLLVVPASIMAMAFSAGLGLVLAAAYVYFRDVRFIVQAVLLVWLYVTPIVYPASVLKGSGPWLDYNPLTGIVTLFQRAALGTSIGDGRSILISALVSIALLVAAVAIYRRHDRLFVDLL